MLIELGVVNNEECVRAHVRVYEQGKMYEFP